MRMRTNSTLACVLATLVVAIAMPGQQALASGGLLDGKVDGKVEILSVEQAFRFDAVLLDDVIEIRWQMPPGYYLYRHAFGAGPGDFVAIEVPDGEPKHDEFFGDVEVYFGEVIGKITPQALSEGVYPARVEVRFQGCAEAGFCYPPQKVLLNVTNSGVSISEEPSLGPKRRSSLF